MGWIGSLIGYLDSILLPSAEARKAKHKRKPSAFQKWLETRDGPAARPPSPSRPATLATDPAIARPRTSESGRFPTEVVGESRYRKSFTSLFGRRTEDGIDTLADALMVPEDSNPHDANAVKITIGGKTVGYLSRSDAVKYRRMVERGRIRSGPQPVRARVRGGWDRGPDDNGEFGVTLDVVLD